MVAIGWALWAAWGPGGWAPAQAHVVNKGAIALLEAKDRQGRLLGTGTGFVVKPEGILVTCYHVLVDAASVDAVFPNGIRARVRQVLEYDRTKDFAILQLEEGFYSTLELGDSDPVRQYQYASALGYLSPNPMRQEGSPADLILQTYGFVLGVHPQAHPEFPLIYTTAAFGPGFSGGPVVNQDNQVIGIAAVEGRAINLALPINQVKPHLEASSGILLEQLQEKDHQSKEALYYRGNYALFRLGDPQAAQEYFQKALDQDPDFVLAHYDLAVAYRDQGLADRATSEYEKVIALNPRFPEALSNLGGHYFRQGKIEKAAELFQRAIEAYPNFIQALSNLGAALNKLGRADEALPHLEKALALDPEFGVAHYNLANALFALNRLEEAKQTYHRSVQLGVDFLSLHWKLYEIHARQENPRQAARELEIILDIDPQNQEAREKLLELRSLPPLRESPF